LIKKSFQNIFLLIASLIFFSWGGVSLSLILISLITYSYFIGILLSKISGNKRKIIFTIGIIGTLSVLIYYKYVTFLFENINSILSPFGLTGIPYQNIVLPIGISFYTFQILSYIIDVYRNKIESEKNIIKFALYISFFPQLIAGPIIQYKNIKKQLYKRWIHLTGINYGIRRFIEGLGKKVIFANTFAIIADIAFNTPAVELNSSIAWIGIIAYTLQIYFDFSGYSDMAIGLGRMFGFKLPENFNYPYISKSIREFWQRWHISLSNWFKEYLYIPLGGNKKKKWITIINLLLVFLATSIWHGASWNFVIWGMTHGFFMITERYIYGNKLKLTWAPIQHFYALFIIITTRVFFKADDLNYAWCYLNQLFSFHFKELSLEIQPYIHNNFIAIILVLAIIGSTPIWKNLITHLKSKYIQTRSKIFVFNIFSISFYSLIFIISVCYLSIGSYNPFIYFKF